MSPAKLCRWLRRILVTLVILTAAGCMGESSTQTPGNGSEGVSKPGEDITPELPPGRLGEQVLEAMSDLTGRLGLDTPDGIDLASAELVTWRDSSLGCHMPDRAYTQVLTPGVLIRLTHGKQIFQYHGSREGTPFICDPPGQEQSPLRGHDDGT
jgi:hypothetical protein